AIAALGLWVCYVSFTQQPAQAFLFPRLISSIFVVLALWTFGRAVLGLSRAGTGIGRTMVLNIVPGLMVAVIYIFWAAETLGFYSGSALAFFALLSLYDPAPHGEVKSWVRRVVITVGFILVMYLLFARLLSVFTPRGLFF
ncbi:MAG: tripartite tricarboxylate transporter TctB family protein, partial [Roseovarius sp.]